MDVSVNGGSLDTRNLARVDSIHAVSGTPTVQNGQVVITENATTAKVGDVFKAESGPLAGQEIPVTSVSTNSFTIATTTPPVNGNQFYLLRRTTSRTNPDGTLIASVQSGPTQFTKDGVDVTVNKDTVAPANTRALPTEVIVSGVSISPATSGLQTTGNATLVSIDTKTPALAAGRVPVDGSGVTQPISASSLPLPTGAATSTAQSTMQTSLNSIDSKLTGPLAVTGAFYQATQPVSAASLPLPTGAATEATLGALNAKVPVQGQALMAASQPVVIASNQTAIPVTSAVSDVAATGTITTQNLVPAGTATAGSAVLSGSLNGAGTASVQVTGTYTGALSLQYTVDGTTWVTAGGTPFLNVATGAYSATIASATQGIFQFESTGMSQYRITALAAVTGTATVSLRTSRATNMVSLDASIPTGTNSIGTVILGAGAAAIGTVTAAQSSAPAKTVKSANITVGTTAVRATTDNAAVTAGRVVLKVKPNPDVNSGKIYIGPAGVTTATGMLVLPAETMEFNFDAGEYYLISDLAAQSVFILEQE